MSQAGWYPDPSGVAQQRWFDGEQWTERVSPYAPPASGSSRVSSPALMVGLFAAALVGTYMAGFTSVSLLTGTSTVWAGAAIVGAAAIACWVIRDVRTWIRVVATILAALSLWSAIYAEVQLDHKRNELSSITSMR